MKKIIYIYISVLFICLSSCDDFLDRYPQDRIAAVNYFYTPDDLKAYMNSFYGINFWPKPSTHGSDFDSDNQISINVNTRLDGTRSPATTGNIGFGWVRRANFFFENYKKVEENHYLSEYQQYLGEAHFFRALTYFSLLQTYGDIQWLTQVLSDNSPELYNAKDPRNFIADKIIEDLDVAITYLQTTKTDGCTRVNKWMALLIQSRVALFEGSWEKYHANTPFGVSGANPNKYFQKAAEAALELINNGPYAIYTTGGVNAYKNVLMLQDFSNNSEIMFWRKYDNDLGRGESAFTNDRLLRMRFPTNNAITKQLADSYLCDDGLPISLSPKFMGHESLSDEMQNRDPRFFHTIANRDEPRLIQDGVVTSYWGTDVYDKLNTTADLNSLAGYINIKGYNPNASYHLNQYEESPQIIYRYAEALLNYAEAKAELGSISQADLDISVNILRARVGMPAMALSIGFDDPAWDFPTLSSLINEIRRERRVELACEGYRWNDIARWAAADELIVGKRPKGFMASQIISINPHPVDDKGFLDPFQKALRENGATEGYDFVLGRDYLNCIPYPDLVLNKNLTQNPGWPDPRNQ